MFRRSDFSSVSRRHFLAVAGSAAASSFASGQGKTQGPATPRPATPTTHAVTIDVTKNPISYSVKGKHAYRLNVKPGDKVTWSAKTSGSTHHLTILFLKETPLVDANNILLFAVHGSESDESGNGIGATIDDGAAGSYEYYVAVFDNSTNATYTDDPKIIVGSGLLSAEAEIRVALDDLRRADAQLPKQNEIRQKIESIERELENLVDKLK